ncbi:MAG: carbohydrate ABC transporter permease [Candidatus Brocadiales bacterium]
MAPAIVVVLCVAVYPILSVLWLSLHRKMLIFNISEFVGLDNYAYLLGDARFWNSLFNTFYFTTISVSLELFFGLIIALAIHRTFPGRGLMRAVVLIPWAIPTVVSAKMWQWIYNPDFGIMNYLLREGGAISANVNWLGHKFIAIHAVILVDVWKTTPFVALLLLAGLQVIPEDLYKAAMVDGASAWRRFWHITLPLLRPAILIALLFRTLDSFRIFDAVYVLTGGGPGNKTETLSVYAYKLMFQTLQFGYGSTISVITFLCVMVISLLYIRFLGGYMRLTT